MQRDSFLSRRRTNHGLVPRPSGAWRGVILLLRATQMDDGFWRHGVNRVAIEIEIYDEDRQPWQVAATFGQRFNFCMEIGLNGSCQRQLKIDPLTARRF